MAAGHGRGGRTGQGRRPLVTAYAAGGLAARRTRSGGGEQAEGAGEVDGFGAVAGAELGVQVPGVGLDGVGGDRQLAGDFRSGQAGGQVAQDAGLAGAERLRQRPGPGGRRRPVPRPGPGPGEQAADLGDQGGVGGAVPPRRPREQPAPRRYDPAPARASADDADSQYGRGLGVGGEAAQLRSAGVVRRLPAVTSAASRRQRW